MFFSKKRKLIKWDFNDSQSPTSKSLMEVTGIRQFKSSLFGIKNDPGSFSYVPHAMEVSGIIKKEKDTPFEEKEVVVLIPEVEMNEIKSGDTIVLWLSDKHKCFRFEKA